MSVKIYTFELENIYLYREPSELQPLTLKYMWFFFESAFCTTLTMKFAPFYATFHFRDVTLKVSSLLQTNLEKNILKSSQKYKCNYKISE